MREILDEIFQTEREAEDIVKAAREKGARRLEQAKEQAGAAVQKAREDAAARMRRELAAAQKEAESRYRQAVERAEEAGRGWSEGENDRLGEIVAKVVEIVLQPAFERGG